ncbi:MAG: Type pili twitching motility protein PilT [Verrucomicrobiales bacterium]|nr:Type pili twitching motility protein PilT [Verrucomicrobiales bacterium]
MEFPHILELAAVALRNGASDLFIAQDAPGRFKVGGLMQESIALPLSRAELAAFWSHCGGHPDTDTDLDTAWNAPDSTRFRVNFHKHLGRLGAVLRQIRTQIPNMESLGLPEELLTNWLSRRSGLILVTGPTGCGKSTTIASCLEWINSTRPNHIITIEDPVEFVFTDRTSFFTQREIGIDTPSFQDGLRRAMRQAPDIIFVGEIRDAATAQIALQAAETGHLVFSTLHSPNIAETIDRLVHLVPPHERDAMLSLLSNQTIGILSQRLLPSAHGPHSTLICESLEVEAAARDWLRAMDIPALADFIRRDGNPHNKSYQQALVEAVHQGRVTLETALATAPNAAEFSRAMRGIS